MKKAFIDRKPVRGAITALALVENLIILAGMVYGSISMSSGADTNSAFGIWLAPIGILVLFPGLAGAYVVYRVIRRHGEATSAARTWAALSALIAPLISCLWMLLLDSIGSSLFRGMEGPFLPTVIGAVVIGLALAPGIVLHLEGPCFDIDIRTQIGYDRTQSEYTEPMNRVAQDISVALKSEKNRRPENEDAGLIVAADQLGDIEGLYVVADGMGGRSSGAAASKLAVESVRDSFLINAHSQDLAALLSESLRAANKAVYTEAQSKPELKGMGTTCVTAAVRDGRAYYAHLGDSRIYLLHNSRLTMLTEDHSFVAEQVRLGKLTEDDARRSRFRNVITKAIGLEPDAQPTTGSVEFEPGDVLLLCSDGLSGPVKDEQIARILTESSDPDEACDRLVNTAIRNGGSDNVTALVASYASPAKTKSASGWLVPAMLGVILGIVLGLVLSRQYWMAKPVVTPPPPQPALSGLAYGDPSSLTYSPVNGGAMAIDRENNVYISDKKQKAILKYGADGSLLATVGKGKLTDPGPLGVGTDGTIYVVDAGRLKAIRPKTTDSRQETTDSGP